MKLEDRVIVMRKAHDAAGDEPVPKVLQGVTRERIAAVLTQLGQATQDRVDAVFALLDDTRPSWYRAVASFRKFAEGASTGHLACHIGILQRGGTKLDREGRDYWVKPLRELGAIEPVILHEGAFVVGHSVAKSPSCAYRLNEGFRAILRAPEDQWRDRLAAWTGQDATRARILSHQQAAIDSRSIVSSPHRDLIQAAISHYVPQFLQGYEVLYVDCEDGERVTAAQRDAMAIAGIELGLHDAMPDILLWNRETDGLWVIEAVTSDGEVDLHKAQQLSQLAARSGKRNIGFTTAYRTWKAAAARQAAHRNLAPGSYLWIQEDPAKQLLLIAT